MTEYETYRATHDLNPQPSDAEEFSHGMDIGNLAYNGVAATYYAVNGGFDWHYDGTQKMDDADRYGKAVEGTVGGILGLIGNGAAYASNAAQRAKASNNYRKRRELRGRNWANTFNMFGNLSTLGRAVTNYAGDTNEVDSDAQQADAWFGTFSTGLKTIGSGINWATSARSNSDRKKISKALGDLINPPKKEGEQEGEDGAEEPDEATARSQMDPNSADFHSFMAKKYALRQAKKFQDNRSTQYHKGMISTISGAISSSGIISAAFAPFGKTGWGKALSGVMPMVGWIGDLIENRVSAASDKNAAEADAVSKNEEIDDFLDEHRDTTDNGQTQDYRDRSTLNDELGINLPLIDASLSDMEREVVFDALTFKRARDIMQSKDEDKAQIYAALHLEGEPTVDEIMSALKGE